MAQERRRADHTRNSATTASSRPSTATAGARRRSRRLHRARGDTRAATCCRRRSVEDMYRPRAFRPHGLRAKSRSASGADGRRARGSDDVKRARSRRRFACAFAVVAATSLAVPFAWFSVQRGARAARSLAARATARPSWSTATGKLLRAFTTADGRWRLPVTTATSIRASSPCSAYEDRRFDDHRGVDARALARAARAVRAQRARRLRRLDADHAGRAPARAARRAHARRQTAPDGARARNSSGASPRTRSSTSISRSRPTAAISKACARPARLFRQGAAAAFDRPRRRCWSRCRSRRKRGGPDRASEARARARDRVLDRAGARGVITRGGSDAAQGGAGSRRSGAPFPASPPHRRAKPRTRTARHAHPALHATISGCRSRSKQLAQEAAERLGPQVTGAILVVDNATGEVRAHVGAADYFSLRARRRHRHDARALRSPGSALKPFIYALAFENGIAHPETMLEDRPSRFGVYAPENFDLTFQGQVTARTALQKSLNMPAVELLSKSARRGFSRGCAMRARSIVLPKDGAPGLAIGLGGARHHARRSRAALCRRSRAAARRPPGRAARRAAPDAARAARRASRSPAWYVADILRGAPPPDKCAGGQDRLQDRHVLRLSRRLGGGLRRAHDDRGLGRPGRQRRRAGTCRPPGRGARPVRRLRARSAPITSRRSARPARWSPRNAQLPPPLRRIGREGRAGERRRRRPAQLKIAYPPDGARVDLGLAQRRAERARAEESRAACRPSPGSSTARPRARRNCAGSRVDARRRRLRARVGHRREGRQRQRARAPRMKNAGRMGQRVRFRNAAPISASPLPDIAGRCISQGSTARRPSHTWSAMRGPSSRPPSASRRQA